jgi:uncharacterized protein
MSQPAKAPEPKVADPKVPEPSIDEILASIRRSIVPDDDAGRDGSKPAARKPAASKSAAAARTAEAKRGQGDCDGRRGAAGGVAQEPDGGPRRAAANQGADQSAVPAGIDLPATAPDSAAESRLPRAPVPDAPLLSPSTTAAVDTAFHSLTRTMLGQHPRTLEDLVRDMLKPMLKEWLDAHLPDLVERLVRAEIERVSRRG